MRLLFVLLATLSVAACFLKPTEPEAGTPRIDLANRLYLSGSWTWADTMTYSAYVPDIDTVPHRGSYIVSGTATLEEVDSADVETYAMTVMSQIAHVDSAGDLEITAWVVTDIEFDDTVRVENDTIFGLEVEPIPPEANATTSDVRWVLNADQLWCTNWLKDTIPEGNRDNCRTVVSWVRAGAVVDSTSS